MATIAKDKYQLEHHDIHGSLRGRRHGHGGRPVPRAARLTKDGERHSPKRGEVDIRPDQSAPRPTSIWRWC